MKKTTVIETKYGKIQGYIEKDINIFKGIPYAAPPVGNRRFMPPEPPGSFLSILEAIKFGPISPQSVYYFTEKPNPRQSEEHCLTLNIWTPVCDHKKRSVMFWIHGGSFTNGNASRPSFNGIHLAYRGKVVIVTINYRLGILGNLFIPEITTNAGLLDMIEALKWVNNNIEYFGGDPNKVTIFGESAGAVAVIALLAMPEAKGLIHRAIAQSGSVNPRGHRRQGGNKVFK